MSNLHILVLSLFVLCGGCITKNYNCCCGDACKCAAKEQAVKVSEPIVSPDKIDGTIQDDGAPQYPNVTPWYIYP